MMDRSTRMWPRPGGIMTVELVRRFTAESRPAPNAIEDKASEIARAQDWPNSDGVADRAASAGLRSRLALRQLMQQERANGPPTGEQQPDLQDPAQAAAVAQAQQQRQYADAARRFGTEGRQSGAGQPDGLSAGIRAAPGVTCDGAVWRLLSTSHPPTSSPPPPLLADQRWATALLGGGSGHLHPDPPDLASRSGSGSARLRLRLRLTLALHPSALPPGPANPRCGPPGPEGLPSACRRHGWTPQPELGEAGGGEARSRGTGRSSTGPAIHAVAGAACPRPDAQCAVASGRNSSRMPGSREAAAMAWPVALRTSTFHRRAHVRFPNRFVLSALVLACSRFMCASMAVAAPAAPKASPATANAG